MNDETTCNPLREKVDELVVLLDRYGKVDLDKARNLAWEIKLLLEGE